MFCHLCYERLSMLEIKFYGSTCNTCEAAWLQKVGDWMAGRSDEFPAPTEQQMNLLVLAH
jgi:hypothetical protein